MSDEPEVRKEKGPKTRRKVPFWRKRWFVGLVIVIFLCPLASCVVFLLSRLGSGPAETTVVEEVTAVELEAEFSLPILFVQNGQLAEHYNGEITQHGVSCSWPSEGLCVARVGGEFVQISVSPEGTILGGSENQVPQIVDWRGDGCQVPVSADGTSWIDVQGELIAWVEHLADGDVLHISTGDISDQFHQIMSPDLYPWGEVVLFAAKEEEGGPWWIYRWHYETGSPVRLDLNLAEVQVEEAIFPSYWPNASWYHFAFAGKSSDGWNIYIHTGDYTGQLTTMGDAIDPDWGPDGIVFTRYTGELSDDFITNGGEVWYVEPKERQPRRLFAGQMASWFYDSGRLPEIQPMAEQTPTSELIPVSDPTPTPELTSEVLPEPTLEHPEDLAAAAAEGQLDIWVAEGAQKLTRELGNLGNLEQYQSECWYRSHYAFKAGDQWYCEVQITTGPWEHIGPCVVKCSPEQSRWAVDTASIREVFVTFPYLYRNAQLTNRDCFAAGVEQGRWFDVVEVVSSNVAKILYGDEELFALYRDQR